MVGLVRFPNLICSLTARMRFSYEYMNYLQLVQVFVRTPVDQLSMQINTLHFERGAGMPHALKKMRFYLRPMIAALAIRSSMSANECLPDIACGFSSGRSE